MSLIAGCLYTTWFMAPKFWNFKAEALWFTINGIDNSTRSTRRDYISLICPIQVSQRQAAVLSYSASRILKLAVGGDLEGGKWLGLATYRRWKYEAGWYPENSLEFG